MTTVLCTLYNSLYLDKGLVLYDSLCECAKDFKLYVLCMDDKCYEVLNDLHQEHHIPVRLSDFEAGDTALLEAKANRPMGEYCWTCSSSFIRYVLKHFNEPVCTYIDADMYFYNDPQVLVDEMLEAGKSVMVVPHRFPKEREYQAKTVGVYCVEFNTFLNRSDSLEVLEYWRNRCLDSCSEKNDGVHWGDQKYLEELVAKYECVHVCKHVGAGVAPWNISDYRGIDGTTTRAVHTSDNKQIDVVFYHYQGVTYESQEIVSTAVRANKRIIDYCLVDGLYYHYLHCIEAKKNYLNDSYGINLLINSHPGVRAATGIRALFHKTLTYKILLKLMKMKNGETYIINLLNKII